jgi:hypothetical protein
LGVRRPPAKSFLSAQAFKLAGAAIAASAIFSGGRCRDGGAAAVPINPSVAERLGAAAIPYQGPNRWP